MLAISLLIAPSIPRRCERATPNTFAFRSGLSCTVSLSIARSSADLTVESRVAAGHRGRGPPQVCDIWV